MTGTLHWYDRWRNWAERRRRQRHVRALDMTRLRDGGLGQPIASAVANATVSAMAQRIGLEPSDLPADGMLRDDIVRNCTKCQNRAECRLWLADSDRDDDGYLDICLNADRFSNLLEQKKTLRTS